MLGRWRNQSLGGASSRQALTLSAPPPRPRQDPPLIPHSTSHIGLTRGTPKTSPLVCLFPRSTTQARRRRCRVDPATRWLGSLRRGRGWRSEASTDLHRFTTESLEI